MLDITEALASGRAMLETVMLTDSCQVRNAAGVLQNTYPCRLMFMSGTVATQGTADTTIVHFNLRLPARAVVHPTNQLHITGHDGTDKGVYGVLAGGGEHTDELLFALDVEKVT